ncbi:hypothetical protein FCM35_KLT01500 [Carex littledalei]|uniref:Uncharacterized protein n=1 Tax=Carex littledalei TaxID=544730 RepID=A0A833VU81_9POAL|nr:hypothetical protein FCM35_KLT01500 [Carex littledalei]
MSKVTKPPSTATTATSVQESEVTSYLYIKPSRNTNGRGWGGQSLEKEAVLRRIRHKKRVDRVRNALSSLLKAMPEPHLTKDGELVVDDAFSSP